MRCVVQAIKELRAILQLVMIIIEARSAGFLSTIV